MLLNVTRHAIISCNVSEAGEHNVTRTAKQKQILSLITEVLKLAPKLQLQGDQLTRDLDLTSSRWTFLGTVAAAERPLTVADLARRMDLRPQTVRRFADALADMAFIKFADNPDHKRAPLIHLTPKGRRMLARLESRELKWARNVAGGLTASEIRTAVQTLVRFRENIGRF